MASNVSNRISLNKSQEGQSIMTMAEEQKTNKEQTALQNVAQIIFSELTEKNKLSFKNNELITKARGKSDNPKRFGKSTSSKEAVSYVLKVVKEALAKDITTVTIDGKELHITEILNKLNSGQSQHVLAKSKKLQMEQFELLFDISQRINKERIEEGIEERTLVDYEEFAKEFFTGSPEEVKNNIAILKAEIDEIKNGKEEKRKEKRLSNIRHALPISNELFEQVFTAKEMEDRKFPYLTNQTLIEGLAFLYKEDNGGISTFIADMTTLMTDSQTPKEVKKNLLNLFISLLNSPYYEDKISSKECADEVKKFFTAIELQDKNFERLFAEKLKGKKEKVFEKKLNEIKAKAESSILMTLSDIINDKKIMEIGKAIINGKDEKMKELAKELASLLPLLYVSYLHNFSYVDFIKNPDACTKDFAEISNRIVFLLTETDPKAEVLTLRKAILKGVNKNNKEKIDERKDNQKKFITYLLDESVKIGDLYSAATLSPNAVENCEVFKRIFNMSRNFADYKVYLNKQLEDKNKPLIIFFAPILREMVFLKEEDAVIPVADRVKKLKESFHKFQEISRRAGFYLNPEVANELIKCSGDYLKPEVKEKVLKSLEERQKLLKTA